MQTNCYHYRYIHRGSIIIIGRTKALYRHSGKELGNYYMIIMGIYSVCIGITEKNMQATLVVC